MKRVVDLFLSISALLIFSPLFIVIALIIYLSDRGPVLYAQKRVGFGCQEFSLYKFRTMCPNADKIGSYSTSTNDYRITRVGKFLRRSSLDELPQLVNVMIGDMSLVGPRPNVPMQRSLYCETDWDKRHSIKPGITGLAQATLRSSATEKQRLMLDLEYVDRMSISFDLKIIFMTIKQVLFKGGN